MGAEAQRAAAHRAAEALPVEEVALGAQPLHDVHALQAEVAGVAAAQARPRVLPRRALRGWGGGQRQGRGF